MWINYARMSTREYNISQRQLLAEAGCEEIFMEVFAPVSNKAAVVAEL